MRQHPLFAAYLAFASVCFFWGTTYLGIRIALESLPPLFLVSTRFILSGAILLTALAFTQLKLPRGRDLWLTSICGFLVLGVGNACLTFAEQLIPSSLAALIIAASPIWMVGIEALFPGGDKITRGIGLGMFVGLVGAALLVGPDALKQGLSGNTVKGFLILQVGGLSWGFGSILQRRFKTETHAVASAAVQQFAAGILWLLPALFETQPVIWDTKGILALIYLTIFGSIVGYTSYVIALTRLPISIVSLYTYINPVVAAILGWLFYREPFGRREVMAMAVIFAGVAIVKRYGHR